MFIPRYWSEAAQRERFGDREVTVRRFGWSSASQADADVHARRRVEEAVSVLRAGGPQALEGFARREHKVAYSGSEGLPIREEIVREVPALDVVLTRNGYGAVCLNTTRAMFVDVDPPVSRVPMWVSLVALAGGLAGLVLAPELLRWGRFHSFVAGAGLVAAVALVLARLREKGSARHGDPVEWSLERVRAWCATRPEWRVAVYRTPAGARLLPVHATFDAGAEPTFEFMEFVGADPLYVRMCRLQRCFRARVSAKPWRAGIADHFRAGGVWPVTDPQKLAVRAAWVERYDRAARDFAACRLVDVVGEGRPDARVEAVRALHDDLCRAASSLALA